jgi:hypothetical protein
MADWKRRFRTSVRRRRTSNVKRLKWTDVLRMIAWPAGEEAELDMWASVVRWVPITAITLCPFAVIFLITMSPPVFDDSLKEAGLFLWGEFCGDVATASIGTKCTNFYIAPVVMIVSFFALNVSFYMMGTFENK